MSIFQSPMGMNVAKNPLTDSPYVEYFDFGQSQVPLNGITTENDIFITTEDGNRITTE